MKNLFLFLMLYSYASAELVDMGTYGSTHTIKETNFMDTIEDKAKDLNQTLLKKQLIDGKNNYMSAHNVLPACVQTRQRDFVPTFVVPTDVVSPSGSVIVKAGTVMNTLDLMKKNHIKLDKYMIFIDANDSVQVQLAYMYKNQSLTYITNGSVDKFEKTTQMVSYKANKVYTEKMGAECVPSVIIQDGSKLHIYEYNIEDLKK